MAEAAARDLAARLQPVPAKPRRWFAMLRCVSKNALGEPVVPEVQDSRAG